MCVVSVKYFADYGFVGCKNRDRNYKPTIRIRKSFRRGIERLYIWDEVTKYTEGLNEFGVCVMSASVRNKSDRKEGIKYEKEKKRTYYSPDGLRLRKSLFEKSPEDALEALIEFQIPGNTFIFNARKCFLLEGSFEDDKYVFESREISANETPIVRTNHGILLSGSEDFPDGDVKKHRASSENRMKVAKRNLAFANSPDDMMQALGDTSSENPQMNPLRIDTTQGAMRTTGQLLLVPKDLTLHYRPIWGDVAFDMDKLNNRPGKCYFEIVSTRKLVSFREFLEEV